MVISPSPLQTSNALQSKPKKALHSSNLILCLIRCECELELEHVFVSHVDFQFVYQAKDWSDSVKILVVCHVAAELILST